MKNIIGGFLLLLGILGGVVNSQPWQPQVLWDVSGPEDSSGFGYRIIPLGDQNDDGFADWAVLSWGVLGTVPGRPNAGKLELFHGGRSIPTQPYRRFLGDSALDGEVEDAFSAGDVNGDGYQDWTIQYAYPDDILHERVYLYLGGLNADTNVVAQWLIANPDAFVSVGDFNGDGYGDLYWYHANPANPYGQIFFGGSVVDTIADWQVCGIQANPLCIGDLNGDDFTDFVGQGGTSAFIYLGLSQPDSIPAYIWSGVGIAGIAPDLNHDYTDELLFAVNQGLDVHWGRQVLQQNADFRLHFPCQGSVSYDVAGLNDINRDGYNDLVIVAQYCTNAGSGMLSVYLGNTWIDSLPPITILARTAPLNLNAIWTAAGLGDINGDRIDDWAIGAYGDLAFDDQRGRVVILSGDTGLVAGVEEPFVVLPQTMQISVYPNPFNSSTTIDLILPTSTSQVDLKVYNVLGQQVWKSTLPVISAQMKYPFDASILSSGLYFLQVSTDRLIQNQKLMVLK